MPCDFKVNFISFFLSGGNHWICISCKSFNSKKPSVNVLDSLGLLTELNSATILEIANLIHTNQSFFSIKKLSVQQQTGTLDCGLFAIAFAIESCLMNDVEMISFDQEEMRNHLVLCLEAGEIVPFPKKKKFVNLSPRPTNHLLKIPIYCMCRLPDVYDTEMIQCDECAGWYHFKCVSMADRDFNYWKCLQCN